MKKILEYIFAAVFLIASFLVCFHLIADKKEQDQFVIFIGEGRSMEPTFYDGDILRVNKEKTPLEDDIIVFECLRCDIKEDTNNVMTKRLIFIDGRGCYWVEGENKKVSLDSRDSSVGWLCPEDIIFLGVVMGVNNND